MRRHTHCESAGSGGSWRAGPRSCCENQQQQRRSHRNENAPPLQQLCGGLQAALSPGWQHALAACVAGVQCALASL